MQPTICQHRPSENMKALLITLSGRWLGERMLAWRLDRDRKYVAEPAPSRMV